MQHNYRPAGVTALGTFTPDNLIAGGFPAHTKSVSLKHGVNYARGAVLQVSATPGIYEKVTTDADAIYVLLEDRDLTAAVAAQPGMIAMTGEFNSTAVSLGAGATLAGVTTALEAKNIYLRATVPVITAD